MNGVSRWRCILSPKFYYKRISPCKKTLKVVYCEDPYNLGLLLENLITIHYKCNAFFTAPFIYQNKVYIPEAKIPLPNPSKRNIAHNKMRFGHHGATVTAAADKNSEILIHKSVKLSITKKKKIKRMISYREKVITKNNTILNFSRLDFTLWQFWFDRDFKNKFLLYTCTMQSTIYNRNSIS